MNRYLILAASMSVLGFASAHAQTFPSTTFDNSAKITQTGNANDAEIDQAVGGIINGQGNAEIIQSGNGSDALITQTNATNAFAAGFANTAVIDQRRARGDATVEQIHDYAVTRFNDALIVQITPDATASILQRGDRNTGVIRQFNTSSDPIANIQQNGRTNTATVRQRGAGGQVDVVQGTFQSGPGISPQTFTSRVTVDNDGVNADIFVSQIGFNQVATIFEDGLNGVINVSMDGASNSVNVDQQSSNGLVEITSTGTSFSNDAEVVQAASDDGSIARVTQSGSYAASDIEQLDGVLGGGENLAEVDQSGFGDGTGDIYSSILQNGGVNTALVDQASSFAQSGITQTGTGHTANVSQ